MTPTVVSGGERAGGEKAEDTGHRTRPDTGPDRTGTNGRTAGSSHLDVPGFQPEAFGVIFFLFIPQNASC